MNKYFKVSFIAKDDYEAVYNTFPCYVAVILLLIVVILDQWAWNLLTCAALLGISILLYRIGYRIGQNIHL